MSAYTKPCGLSEEIIRQYNRDLTELFSIYLNVMPTAIDNAMVDDLAAACGTTRAEAYAHLLAAMAGLDPAGKDRRFFQYWLAPAIHELDMRTYTEDAYFKRIKIPTATKGNWLLRTQHLAPLEAFVCNDFAITPDRRMIPQIGFFEKEYPYPAMLEGGREWMTLLPNEMVTTYPAIRKAHGRVLTFGLGLGYFAFHAAEKDNVESVTVVDISPDVIDLFRTHILPQFPHKEKINLVCKDAFAFADEDMAGNFDFLFADIWHDAGDGKELYLKCKAYEEKHPSITFTYWLEDTIKCYLDETLW